jgi:hypothetical protein
MDSRDYKRLFKLIAKTESGSEQNLDEIENRLAHLRKGVALSYGDLETIADPRFWPFSKYWMWPDKKQIEKKLEITTGWFKSLPLNEAKIIQGLDKIFKNIALVSIILRFAQPEHYAIYSRPVLQILRIERGGNEVDEYLNYIVEMRVLRDCFGMDKTAEVDEIVWAIFHLKDQYGADLKKILAKRLPENLTAEELLVYLSHDPLKIAKEYLKRKDHMTAGFWATRAFEKFLDDECRDNGIYVFELLNKLSNMIAELREHTLHWNKQENRRLLYETKKIRNMLIHSTSPLSLTDVERFISNIETLKRIAIHRGY